MALGCTCTFGSVARSSHHERHHFILEAASFCKHTTSTHTSSSKHDHLLNGHLHVVWWLYTHGKLFAADDERNDRHCRNFAEFLCAFVLEYSRT
eukprot:scaffold11648_cov151-Skeletonema_marinoi.AAC.3